MSDADKVFVGSIPENYDRYLVPLIFEGFAEDIAQRVASKAPSSRGLCLATPSDVLDDRE